MARTEFLETLHPVDECPPKANRVAQHFMKVKGYGDRTPLGVFIDGPVLYYYYHLPEGVLEVELARREGRWQRRVSDFITNAREVAEMLGDQPAPRPQDAPPVTPPVVFKGSSV